MPIRNSGGVISRGFGEFSRVITRGFGKFFRTLSFPLKREKEPIIREFNFEIYSPISKEIEISKIIEISFIKRLILSYLIKSNIKHKKEVSYDLFNSISKTSNYEHDFIFNVDNRNLIKTLDVLFEND